MKKIAIALLFVAILLPSFISGIFAKCECSEWHCVHNPLNEKFVQTPFDKNLYYDMDTSIVYYIIDVGTTYQSICPYYGEDGQLRKVGKNGLIKLDVKEDYDTACGK